MDLIFRLGVISDTHGEISRTKEAIRIFQDHGVSAIVHCGDIGGASVVRAFQGLETHFVFGNTDGESEILREVAHETGNTLHGWFGSLERAGKKIFFLHGHQTSRFDEELRSGHWDLICFGHTHVSIFQRHGATQLLNPGAFQRVVTPQIAIVSLPDISVESFVVETI